MRGRVLAVATALGIALAAVATPASAAVQASAKDELTAVSCPTATYCVSVGLNLAASGGKGAPLSAAWTAGHGWKSYPVKLPAGATAGGMEGISCVTTKFCVAVGAYSTKAGGHLLAEFWNGSTWTPAEPPAKVGASTLLEAISCPSAKSCTAVGADDTSANPNSGFPIAETWNGTTRKWTETKLPHPAGMEFGALIHVSCPTTAYCVGVGQSDTTTSVGPIIDAYIKGKWSAQKAPVIRGGIYYTADVSCPSTTSCAAIGDFFSLSGGYMGVALTSNGTTWKRSAVSWPGGEGSDSVLMGVSCSAVKNCVAVGIAGDQPPFTTLDAGDAVALSWTGGTWHALSVPGPSAGDGSAFLAVSCRAGKPTATCAAVGSSGPTSGSPSSGLSGFYNGKSWTLLAA